MKHALVLFALLAAACSDSTVAEPVTQQAADGGTVGSSSGVCADTGFNPEPCTTESGHTYSFIQNAGTGGSFTVVSGATMDFSLNGGGTVTLECKAGSTCDVTLNGGTASITCDATATCNVTCNGGTGTLSCNASATSCKLAQIGGQCVQS